MVERRGDGGRHMVGNEDRYPARSGNFAAACQHYLHNAFDLWVNVWRTKCVQGDVIVMHYADDILLGFQYRAEADRFLELRSEERRVGKEGRAVWRGGWLEKAVVAWGVSGLA